MATQVITEDDRLNLRYFILDKGDVTRWVSWESKKEAIFAHYPELRAALHNLDAAERNLKFIVEGIANGELG